MAKILSQPMVLAALFLLAACSGGGTMNSSVPTSQAVGPQSAQATTQSQTRTTLGKPAPADGSIVYNSVPKTLLGSASEGFECCQISEFGDGVNLAGTGTLDTVSVVMDSWGCQSGTWHGPTDTPATAACSTTPGATFPVPITLNVYAVCPASGPVTSACPSPTSRVGVLLATQTKTFAIPYRPSAQPAKCTAANGNLGKFFSATDQAFYRGVEGGCDNGLVNLIAFDNIVAQPHAPASLPSQIIVTLAYNTTHYGYHPVGESAACYTSSGGCGYDSLNVSADSFTGPVTVGSYYAANGLFLNSSYAGTYCDGGPAGALRFDAGGSANCGWAAYHPQIQVTVSDKKDKDDKTKDKGDKD